MARAQKVDRKGDQELSYSLKEALILENRVYGRKLARKFLNVWNFRIDWDEVCSLVDMALCVAAKRFRVDRGACFKTFLFFYVKGELTAEIRKRKRAPVSTIGSQELESKIEQSSIKHPTNDLSITIQSSLRHLSRLERIILVEVFFEDRSSADIAKQLGYTRHHVTRLKRQALRKMRDSIEDEPIKYDDA